MKNKLQIFKNKDFGEIRTVEVNGEPYFVGKDVAAILGYKNTRIALQDNVGNEDKGVTKVTTSGGKEQTMTKKEIQSLISKALIELGVKGHVRIVSAGIDRYEVIVNGEYYGVYDVHRKTFVD